MQAKAAPKASGAAFWREESQNGLWRVRSRSRQKSRFLVGRGQSARITFAPDWISSYGDQSIEKVADRPGTDVSEPPQPTGSRQFAEDVKNSIAPQEQVFFPLGVASKNEDRVYLHCLRMVSGYSLECFSLQRRKEKVSFAVFLENKIDSSVAQPAHPVEKDYGLFGHSAGPMGRESSLGKALNG
jgi:hypothetical protein